MSYNPYRRSFEDRLFNAIPYIIIFAAIAVFSLVILPRPIATVFNAKGFEYSEGDRVGLPYKIAKQGIFWKTNEGRISLQLTTRDSDGRMINEVLKFSTSSQKVIDAMNQGASENRTVTIKYRVYFFRGFQYGDTSYDAYDATVNPK